MSNFSEKASDVLMDIAEKVDSNKYLSSVKNGFTIYMPFIIVGSFATLFNTLVCSPVTGLAKFIPALENIKPAFAAVNFAAMSLMTIPIIFLIALQLAKQNKVPEYISAIVAVISYFCVIPQEVSVTIEEVVGTGSGLGAPSLGAQGLFIGMILSILVVELFSVLMKIDKIKIKMPPSVPTAIATSFNTLIPIFITLSSVSIIGVLFRILTGAYMNEWIYEVVQAPVEAIFQSPIGVIAIVVFAQVFWFLGIHGNMVVSPIRNPLIAAAIAANIAAANAGDIPNQPVTYGFWVAFVVVGGAGIVLSLLFAIFLFSKREDHRMIAKLGILPGLFGISEPIVFGLPLVLNPTFALPFIFSGGIATAIALFATNIGFLPCNIVDVPFGLPIIVSAFIGHGWQGVIVQIIILAVCTLAYTPFVLLSNKQAKLEKIEE